MPAPRTKTFGGMPTGYYLPRATIALLRIRIKPQDHSAHRRARREGRGHRCGLAGVADKRPGQEFIYPRLRVASRDYFECRLHPGVGFDAVDLTSRNERRYACPGAATFDMTGEK
jgi:hypothetical protein